MIIEMISKIIIGEEPKKVIRYWAYRDDITGEIVACHRIGLYGQEEENEIHLISLFTALEQNGRKIFFKKRRDGLVDLGVKHKDGKMVYLCRDQESEEAALNLISQTALVILEHEIFYEEGLTLSLDKPIFIT